MKKRKKPEEPERKEESQEDKTKFVDFQVPFGTFCFKAGITYRMGNLAFCPDQDIFVTISDSIEIDGQEYLDPLDFSDHKVTN